MTYRRLFHYLLIVGIILLLGVWGLSAFREIKVIFQGQECSVVHGSLVVEIHETPRGIPGPRARALLPDGFHYQRAREVPPYRYAGRWRYQRSHSEVTWTPASTGPVPATPVVRYYPNHTYHVPLWALWLVYVGGAFAFCSFMEMRTAGGEEKKLAEEHASDR
ncbi:MAG: hypothetical protein EOP88_11205 [Verrucomicrobiaceae bacterium]|nr:MAG: hypothetical protein EOP88_11205 [Verrucomicrobiaceae bacterium]